MNRNEALAEYQRTGNYGLREEASEDSKDLILEWLTALRDNRAECRDACENIFLDPDFARTLCYAALTGGTLTMDSTDWPLNVLADKLHNDYIERARDWQADREAWEA